MSNLILLTIISVLLNRFSILVFYQTERWKKFSYYLKSVMLKATSSCDLCQIIKMSLFFLSLLTGANLDQWL